MLALMRGATPTQRQVKIQKIEYPEPYFEWPLRTHASRAYCTGGVRKVAGAAAAVYSNVTECSAVRPLY